MDAKKLAEARDIAQAAGGSGCVTRHGKLVMAWGDQKQRYHVFSASKGIGVTALGLAIKDGKMSLSDRAQKHHPQLGASPEKNTKTGWLDDITILHLATHTAGFPKTKGFGTMLFAPGSKFCYSDGGANWLAECITLSYRQDIQDLMQQRVFAHLGLNKKGPDISFGSGDGRPAKINGIVRRQFGAGVSANVDALARVGYLYLRGGRWEDQQLIPEEFVDQVRTTPRATKGLPVHLASSYGEASNHHGLLWWNNQDGAMKDVPRDAFWAWGFNENLIIVVPSLDLVVARAGNKSWADGWSGDYKVRIEPLLKPIVQSIEGSPYPQSSAIESMTIDPQRISIGNGDNWPITWADDGYQYTVFCDGNGFGGKRGSMSPAKITGSPPRIAGRNIDSPTGYRKGDGPSGRKACGLLMVDGVLYMWVRNLNRETGSSLAWSADHAKTWTWASWSFPEIGYPVWLNAGQNYAAARDEYVYFYSPDGNSAYEAYDGIILARAPKDRITSKDAYQFYAGTDANGEPPWNSDFRQRKPVFQNPARCYRPSVVYNPGLRRYLLLTMAKSTDRSRRYLGVFDAPKPWGPWTTVAYIDKWSDPQTRFQPHIPSKWISADGKSFYLLYSAYPRGPYKFNLQKCTLTLKGSQDK